MASMNMNLKGAQLRYIAEQASPRQLQEWIKLIADKLTQGNLSLPEVDRLTSNLKVYAQVLNGKDKVFNKDGSLASDTTEIAVAQIYKVIAKE